MNETASHFLDCYARGIEPDEGWTFGKALRQAQLDHSPESLERIDMLLDQIKAKVKPERESFLATPGGRNFCALLAYYLVTYVAKRSFARIDWHDFESAQRVLGSDGRLPEGSLSRIVAISQDAGVALLPLGWIEAKLFDVEPAPPCRDYVAGVAAQLDHAGPIIWAAAARALGVLASASMNLLVEEVGVMQVLETSANGEHRTFRVFAADTPEAALARCKTALENPEGAPFAAFACEAAVELPGGRADAVLIELRCHGDKPLALSFAFAFRPASDPRGFAILDTHLIEGHLPPEAAALFDRALGAGIEEYNWPVESGSWARFRAAAATQAVAVAANDEALAYDDGQPVLVGDAVLSGRGLFPSRITEIAPTGLRLEICTGSMQTLAPSAVKEELALVAREPADFRTACVRWLEDRSLGGASDRSMRGSAHARYALGNLLFHGVGMERDLGKALRLWQSAADAGHAAAEREMGIIYLEGDALRADVPKALELLGRAAGQDDARAHRVIGTVHEMGKHVPQALGKAVTSYRYAAELGDLVGLTHLARLHLEGKGVARDETQAVQWLAQAAQGGLADAQFQLAMCHQEGRGVPQDYARCVHFYAQAAAQGHGAAINNLADKYEHGLGVPQDLAKALALYREAADKNILAAWYSLGVMYAEGRGVVRDREEAIRRLKLAARYEFLDAPKRLRELEKSA